MEQEDKNKNQNKNIKETKSTTYLSPSSCKNNIPTSYASAVTNTNNLYDHNLVTKALQAKTIHGIADSAASRHFGPATGESNQHETVKVAAANRGIMLSMAKRKWNLAEELTTKCYKHQEG